MAKLPSADQLGRAIPQSRSSYIPNVDTSPVTNARMQIGNALSEGAQQVNRMRLVVEEQERREADKLDAIRAEEAFNRLRQRQLDLSMGENGFSKIRGSDVVNRAVPVLDEYPKLFQSAMDEISSTLSNDRQRQMFRQRAEPTALGFKGDILRHVMSETETHKNEVMKGTIDVEVQNASANWFSQSTVDKALLRIDSVIDETMDGRGMPPEQIQAMKSEARMKINGNIVAQAINNNNIDFAEEFIAKHADNIDTASLVKFNSAIEKVRNEEKVTAVVDNVVKAIEPSVMPNDEERLISLIAQVESGNRDYDSNGNVVTSPRGAKGRMQVMDATAKNPGFGVRPAADDSLEERARVGRDYFGAMLREFKGNVPQALAAYNAGPDAVNKAMKKAEKDEKKSWLDYLPEETQTYVQKITNSYAAGEAPREPTVVEVRDAVAAMMEGEPASLVKQAQDAAEARLNDMNKAKTQKADSLLEQIMARVDAGEITEYSQLTPDELTTLGRSRTAARSYIESVERREQDLLELSPAATSQFFALLTDPVALKEKSIPDIMAMAPDIGRSRVDRLLSQRAQYINRPETERAATVDADQFKALAIRFGFNMKSDKAKKELVLIKDRTEQTISAMQNQLGRTLTRDEKDKVIKRMMVEFPEIRARNDFFGYSTTIEKRGYDVNFPQNIVIPKDFRKKVDDAAKAANLQFSEADIRDMYTEYLLQQQGIN